MNVSATAATVRTLSRPSTTMIATPGSGPTPATAIGRASIPAPTVSVRVSPKVVQNGGSSSRRRQSRARDHRSFSSQVRSVS